MNGTGDSFVAEDFLRVSKGDVALWAAAGVIVAFALVGGVWAYQALVPVQESAGEPAGAIVVEFAEFAVSPATEEFDLPEADPSAPSEAAPPSEAEPDPDAEPLEETEPVVEEVEPEKFIEREVPAEPVQPAVVEPPPEPAPEPEPVVPEPEEPVTDIPDVDVPEPAVIIQRQAEPITPEPEEPVAEPFDPNLPVPVTMSARIAETRAETPPTKFTPQPRRAPPPQQAAIQASAPKPQNQQAQQAAAPQQAASPEPSASQISRWETSVHRHLLRGLKYPMDARRRGERGRVWVQFSIDAAGNVLSVSVTQSSGFALLDQAATDLARASSPVPRPPEGMPKARLGIIVPIDYGR